MKQKNSWISTHYTKLLIGILFFAFFTRVFRLNIPERYIFDEVYHSVTAHLIAENDQRAYEWWNPPPEKNTAVDWLHPPLAKYTQALAINIFGYTSFGWRLSSALFGVAVIYLLARFMLEVTHDYTISIVAAVLASLEGLLLVMSRIAMNDIHVTFAVLLTLLVYLKVSPFTLKKELHWHTVRLYALTGVCAGIAIATKWSGVFVLGVIFFYETLALLEKLYFYTKQKKRSRRKNAIDLKQIATHFFLILVAFVVLPVTVYILSYSQMFLQGKDWNHFVELHKQIWWYQNNLEATHGYQSTPAQWLLNQKPVWFHVVYEENGSRGDIYAHGNSIILWSGLLAVFGYALHLVKKLLNAPDTKQPIETVIAAFRTTPAFLLLCYFAMWIVWVRSPRIMFFYHYAVALPFLIGLLSMGLMRLIRLPEKYQPLYQALAITLLTLAATYFVLFYPHWTAIPLPVTFVESVYFFFESWK